MPATEKDVFLKAYEREFKTTMRVLNAYPKDKLDLTADNLRSARDIASLFVGEQAVVDMAMNGNIDFSAEPAGPSTIDELIAMFQGMFQKNIERVTNLSDTAYNAAVVFPTGPGTGSKLRTADVLWLTLYDMVHHRGQLSVYLRLAGGKVPSIYGPSADEVQNVFLI
jgi:uncharacterized damage-inducible protein DinB